MTKMGLGSGMWCSDASYFNCCCSALIRSVNETTKVWNAFLLCLSQNEPRSRDPEKKTERQLRFIVWQQGIIYWKKKTKSVTRHQFSPLVWLGKAAVFHQRLHTALILIILKRAQFWSKVDTAVSDWKFVCFDSDFKLKRSAWRLHCSTHKCWKMPESCKAQKDEAWLLRH